jgi:hypothetical protein
MLSAFVCGCVLTLTSLPLESVAPAGKPVLAGIPILITRGDTIAKIGDLPAELKIGPFANLAVGYKYSYFGVFWLDFWTWGGEYCMFEGKGFEPLSAENCAKLMNTEVGKLSPPLVYRFPLGLVSLGGLFAVLVPLGIMANAREKKEKARIQALFDDSRYQAAFEIFNRNLPDAPQESDPATSTDPDGEVIDTAESSQPATSSDATPKPEVTPEQHQQQIEEAIQAAVDHLVHNGEDRDVADANFKLMLGIVAHANQTPES